MAILAPPPASPAVPDATGGRAGRRVASGALVLGALGVVFGDIGTSVLYALRTVFDPAGAGVPLTPQAVLGVLSMVIWSITLVVSVKYVAFVMRADDEGEGGVMALIGIVQRLAGLSRGSRAVLVGVGLVGAALFLGDAMITPAISVLSAVEGLEVISPALESAVLPIALAILVALFAAQALGTAAVGRFFGPVCAVWFAALAAAGLAQVAAHPGVLRALSPTYAADFALARPGLTFLALGGIVLTITGVEALYADMGHFGRAPIRRAWLLVVFPALALNYLGQGALLLSTPAAIENPFLLLYPDWARPPMVLLATAATVIASQAVISGAFSIARQAVRLGFMPRVVVRHTSSANVGQVYVPAVNWGLLVAVVALVVGFGSSSGLAAAYGIAVTGTLLATTALFAVVLRVGLRRPLWVVVGLTSVFATVDLLFFAASAGKVLDGGWFPLAVALIASTVLMTWDRGRRLVTARRTQQEGPLRAFVQQVHDLRPPVQRVAGTAIFLNADPTTTPLALRANVEHNHTLHEQVVILSVQVTGTPHVPAAGRVAVDDLGYADDGIRHVTVRFGFRDDPDVPAALTLAAREGSIGRIDVAGASWFLSRITLRRGARTAMAGWRTTLFLRLARHAANPVDYFNLPDDRTIVMGGHITI